MEVLRMIVFGAPGTGKGTHSANLSRRLGIPCISTGQLLREAVMAGNELGQKVKAYTDSGQLVPDGIMIDLVDERLANPDCASGYILDGFPRTLDQAEALAERVSVDVVLSLEVPDDEIETRMTGRRVCAACGTTYHTEYNPPRTEDVCDQCGKELSLRVDDRPETVRARLRAYHQSTEPIKGYYAREGKLKSVSSRGAVEETAANCMRALGLT